MNNNLEKENVFSKLKNNYTAISVCIIFLILILLTLYILFNNSWYSSNQNSISLSIFVIITFVLLSLALGVLLIPNLKNIDIFFNQIKNTFYFILYTICLILFFRLIPSSFLNQYATIILLISLLVTSYLFYLAFKTNYILNFNTNYEKMKMILLFFSLITILILYYSVDPGGLVKKNVGNSFLFTVLLSIFAFLYLILFLLIDSNASNSSRKEGNESNYENGTNDSYFQKFKHFFDFSHFNLFVWILNFFFVFFIISLIIGIINFPGGFFSNVGISTAVLVFSFLIFIIWGSCLFVTYAPTNVNKIMDLNQVQSLNKSILLILSIIVIGLILGWFLFNIKSFSGGESSLFSLIINICIILLILTFIYKIMNVSLPTKNKKNSRITDFFELIKKVIFYIPCFLSEIFDNIVGFLTNEYNNTTKNNIYFLIFTIIIIVFYYLFFYVKNIFLLQGGKRLVTDPISTSTLHPIASYEELNGSKETKTISASLNKIEVTSDTEQYNYQYGLSFWVFINSVPPSNYNNSNNKYISLLDYGNKPNILYNFQKNTFIIVMENGKRNTNRHSNIIDLSNNELEEENSFPIVFKQENFLLQKWNNIILNVQGGTLDIFINGEIVKSVPGMVPYMTLDQLTIGTNNGISGGICNLIYFNRPLTYNNIYYLYNSGKNQIIPIF